MFVAVLSIVLTAAAEMGLSPSQTSSWIAVLYGLPALPSVVLSIRYRQPLLLTGNVFAVIFLASLGRQVGYAELAGASMLAGALVLLAAVLGLTKRFATWVPAPIVHGLIAGAVLPFVTQIFTGLSTVGRDGEAVAARLPLMVGAALLAFLLSQRFLGQRVPPIFPALLAGLAVAGATGQFGTVPSFELPLLEVGQVEFSLPVIVTATPVLAALILLQSNLPSMIYMRSQGFDPPERAVSVMSGAGTIVGSVLGPVAVSLAVPLVPLIAGPGAGERSMRYPSVFIPAVAMLLITLLAGTATEIAVLVPTLLLLTLGGLALIAVLVGALREIARGPLVLGPIFAFVIALSQMRLFGLGPFFWSLVVGTAVSLLLEREEWKTYCAEAATTPS